MLSATLLLTACFSTYFQLSDQRRQAEVANIQLILAEVDFIPGKHRHLWTLSQLKFEMTAVTVSLFFTVLLFASVLADPKTINAVFGETVTLPCRARNSTKDPDTVVEWSRADLHPEYILLHRDGHSDPVKQHLSFKNRVELQDKEMKDGDVSLIVKNVTIIDTGTYECRIRQKSRTVLGSVPISTIYLRVAPPGQTQRSIDGENEEDGSAGLKVGLSASGLLLLVAAVVGVLIYRHKKQQS